MSEPCVFCGIVAGTEPATIVRAWPDALAFTPLNPVTAGHTLVIPRVHVPDAVTDPDVTAVTMRRATELAGASEHSNLLTSVGAPATQSIYHLHIHVVPRSADDWLMLPWGTTGDPHEPHSCKAAEQATEALDRVRALHLPSTLPFISGRKKICQGCAELHPCPTIRAIDTTTEEDGDPPYRVGDRVRREADDRIRTVSGVVERGPHSGWLYLDRGTIHGLGPVDPGHYVPADTTEEDH